MHTTIDYLRGRRFAPQGVDFDAAVKFWKSMASDPGAKYDDTCRSLTASDIEPMVSWGINPGQAVGVTQRLPKISDAPPEEREVLKKAYEHTGFEENRPLKGLPVDVAFIGSCTNGRISDLREAARVIKGRKVSPTGPGACRARLAQRRAPGGSGRADRDLPRGGFQWREAGCSMCLAMNPDKLDERQVCASSSNRNFIGRQGSPGAARS